jgi:hypothetical protein
LHKGTGVRVSRFGVRFLSLEKDGDILRISALGSDPSATVNNFLDAIPDAESSIALGLCPGDFVFSSLSRDEDMSDDELESHLRWEIGKKAFSGSSNYNVDCAFIGEIGFAFAGRKKLISDLTSHGRKVFTDVEPAALFNGVEGAGELTDKTLVIVSVEAEGISSVVVENRTPVGIDSIPIIEKELASVLLDFTSGGISDANSANEELLAGYIIESIGRITFLGENKKNPSPQIIMLAGAGAYMGNIPGRIEKMTGIAVKISSPFGIITDGKDVIDPSFSDKGAAFTTCVGLALRAMEI